MKMGMKAPVLLPIPKKNGNRPLIHTVILDKVIFMFSFCWTDRAGLSLFLSKKTLYMDPIALSTAF